MNPMEDIRDRLKELEVNHEHHETRLSDHEIRVRSLEAQAYKIAAFASLGGMFGGAVATAIAKAFLR